MQPRRGPAWLKFLQGIPTPLAIVLGIMFGMLISRSFDWGSHTEGWRGGQSGPAGVRLSSKHAMAIPTPEQRLRVLKLLTSLSPHHTKECTRNAQPLYVDQAEQRYSSLIGYNPPTSSSWLHNLGFGVDDQIDLTHSYYTDLIASQHKYYFAINLYNSFDVIPDLFATLFRVAAIVGYQNVFVSIYENGSTDQTKALLRIFDALTRSVGMRVSIRTSMRTRGAFAHRIEYLAEVRNAAFVPLHDLRDSEGEYFDTIIFMNDILPCVDDLLELLWQSRRNNAGITCAADYMWNDETQSPVFYDNWVSRDVNGTALENAPFESVFHHPESSDRFQHHLPVQVQACWNGVAILDPAPFYSPPHVRFRMAKILEDECSASECSLICNDYWESGYGRIMMVPRVKLAYDRKVFDIIHPQRRNLSAIRGYVRIGGLPEDPRSDPQDRSWFGPHDRLFVSEESELVDFVPGPESVWCWGWDGAGDLDGPDVDPVWEPVGNRSRAADSVLVKHDRSMWSF